MCEIMAPEGKGKFLKFIGGNYVYVLLENVKNLHVYIIIYIIFATNI